MKLKSYQMGDLFQFKAIKQAKSQKNIPSDNSEYGVPYIIQSTRNNMFSRNVNKEYLINNNEAPVSGNKIVLGVTLPAVSYQPKEFGASQVITAYSPNLNKWNGNYIVTVISKLLYKFSYGEKPGLKIYKEMSIELPSSENGDPDWDFMSSYIKDKYYMYIKKLDNYLNIHGFGNLDKTSMINSNDKNILKEHHEAIFQKFKVKSLFNFIKRGKRLKSSDRIMGNLPFITAGVTDMGISSYIGNKDIDIFPSNSLTIDMFGKVYYRGFPFGADDHVTVLHDSKEDFLKEHLQYIQPCIERAISGIYSYSHNFYPKDTYDIEIKLPVKGNEIDMHLIYEYIKVINKKDMIKLRQFVNDEMINLKQ